MIQSPVTSKPHTNNFVQVKIQQFRESKKLKESEVKTSPKGKVETFRRSTRKPALEMNSKDYSNILKANQNTFTELRSYP